MSKSICFFIKKNCDNKIPKAKKFESVDNISLIENTKKNLPKLIKLINEQNLNEYIKLVVSLFI